MPDFTGTRAREDALTIPCSFCNAPIGEPCMNRVLDPPEPLHNFAAHLCRLQESEPF